MASQVTVSDKQARRQNFLDAWPVIRDEVLEYVKSQKFPDAAVEWFRNVSDGGL